MLKVIQVYEDLLESETLYFTADHWEDGFGVYSMKPTQGSFSEHEPLTLYKWNFELRCLKDIGYDREEWQAFADANKLNIVDEDIGVLSETPETDRSTIEMCYLEFSYGRRVEVQPDTILNILNDISGKLNHEDNYVAELKELLWRHSFESEILKQ
jgi:hypothetical protein